MSIRGTTVLLLVCAACAHTPAPMTIPAYEAPVEPVAIDERPRSLAELKPELVEYPGLGVEYVANVEEETYRYHERYYCFVEGRWFRADAMGGPWDVLPMKYVPVAIYRVRGHLPPELEERARAENKPPRISLVSFQLVAPADG